MKPLSEWAEEDLIAELTHPRASGPHQSDRRAAALAELLRRERYAMKGRCADAIAVLVKKYADAAATLPESGVDEFGEWRNGPVWTPQMDGTWSGLQIAEGVIRGMQ